MKELLGDNYKNYLYNKDNLIKYLKEYKHSMVRMRFLEDSHSNGILFKQIGVINELSSNLSFEYHGFIGYLWAFLLNSKNNLTDKQKLKIEFAIQNFVSALKEIKDRPSIFGKTNYVKQKITQLQSDKSYKYYNSKLGFFSAMTFHFSGNNHAMTAQIRKYPTDDEDIFRFLVCNGGEFSREECQYYYKNNKLASEAGFVANEYKMNVKTLKEFLFDVVDFVTSTKSTKTENFFTELDKNIITHKNFGLFQDTGNCVTNSPNILLKEILDDDLLHTLFRDFFLNKNAKGEFLLKMPDFIQKLKKETIKVPEVKRISDAEKTEYFAKIENVLNKIYENENQKLRDIRLKTIKEQPIEKVITLDVLKDLHNEFKIKQLEKQILDLAKGKTVIFLMYREHNYHTKVEVKEGNILIKNNYNKADGDLFTTLHFDQITEKILFYTKLKNRISKDHTAFKDYIIPVLREDNKFNRTQKEFYINIKSALGIELTEYDNEVTYKYKDHNDEEHDVKIELETNKVFQDRKEISRAEFIDTIHEPLNIAIIDQNNQKLDKNRAKIEIKENYDEQDESLKHEQPKKSPLVQSSSDINQNNINEIPKNEVPKINSDHKLNDSKDSLLAQGSSPRDSLIDDFFKIPQDEIPKDDIPQSKIEDNNKQNEVLKHQQPQHSPLIQPNPPSTPKQTPPKQKSSIHFNKIKDASYQYEAVIGSRKIVRSKTDNLNEIRVHVDNVLEQIVKERPEILDLKNKAENLFKSLAEYSHKYSHLKGKDAGFQAWKGKPEFQEILQKNSLGTDATSLNELGKISGFYQKKGSKVYTETGRVYLDGLFSRTYRDACVLYPPERGLAEFSKTQSIN
jgi:hypothetical protein